MAEWKRISLVYRQVKTSTNNRRKQGYSTLQESNQCGWMIFSDESNLHWPRQQCENFCRVPFQWNKDEMPVYSGEEVKTWIAAGWRGERFFCENYLFKAHKIKFTLQKRDFLIIFLILLYFRFYYSVKNFSFGEKHLFIWVLLKGIYQFKNLWFIQINQTII